MLKYHDIRRNAMTREYKNKLLLKKKSIRNEKHRMSRKCKSKEMRNYEADHKKDFKNSLEIHCKLEMNVEV
jgi:hypothetical protein